MSYIFQSFCARVSIVLSCPDNLKTAVMLDFQATRWGQGASYFFTFMALAIIIPDVSVYFQLCFVPFVVYILCAISYLQLTPGCISNKSNAECVFDYYVRADKQHKFWLVEGVFSQMRSNCVTDHKPQAVFSISENNRIGFPAFRGAAARQNEWKWILATFATFSEKCKSIQSVTFFSVVSEQKQVRMSRTLNGITKERLEKTSFLKRSCFMWSGI